MLQVSMPPESASRIAAIIFLSLMSRMVNPISIQDDLIRTNAGRIVPASSNETLHLGIARRECGIFPRFPKRLYHDACAARFLVRAARLMPMSSEVRSSNATFKLVGALVAAPLQSFSDQ